MLLLQQGHGLVRRVGLTTASHGGCQRFVLLLLLLLSLSRLHPLLLTQVLCECGYLVEVDVEVKVAPLIAAAAWGT